MKKVFKKILIIIFLLIILLGTCIFLISRLHNDIDYTISTKLAADLVYDCQQVSQISKVDWWLLTAVFYNLQKEPSLTEVLEVAEGIKTGKVYPRIIQDKKLWKKIKHDATNIKKSDVFYSTLFSFPLEKGKVNFTDTFGALRDGDRSHEGIDLFAPEGTPIYAVCSGKIVRLGWNTLGGERIGIRSQKGFYYYYAHLSGYKKGIHEGDRIDKGDLIGYVGHTGNAQNTPNHLHFGIMSPQGTWLNPYNYLKYWFKYTNL